MLHNLLPAVHAVRDVETDLPELTDGILLKLLPDLHGVHLLPLLLLSVKKAHIDLHEINCYYETVNKRKLIALGGKAMITEFGKTVTMNVLNRMKNPEIFYCLERIIEPEPGEFCYLLEQDKRLRPIKMLDGQLWGTHGFSNFWRWIDLESGKEESGYGGFYKLVPSVS